MKPAQPRVTISGNAHETIVSQAAWTWVAKAIDAQGRGDMLGAVAAFRMAAAFDPAEDTVPSCSVMILDMLTDEPDVVFGERRAYDRQFCRALTAAAAPHANDRDPERKLRVGYLSSDFRAHSAAGLFLPVIAYHDRAGFEAHLYLTGKATDMTSRRFSSAADGWHPVAALDHAALAAKIRADRIDVLVDLSGYTQGHRLLTLARRPAPFIVTGWGSTMGTGLGWADYLVSDAIAIPPEAEHHYHERIIRLPCLVGLQPSPLLPPLTPPPLVVNGYATFGCLGRPTKLTDETLRVWASILRRLPGSRLFLKNGEYDDQRMRLRVLDTLVALGIGPERVAFGGLTASYDHQAAYGRVDVALDTWPENGGTTVLDALLMGVPVVAKLGTLAPGRQASSILSVVGLCAPIDSVAAYTDRAVAWASDPGWLSETRRTLRRRLLASPICDGPGYALSWETEIRRAWRSWCHSRRADDPVGAGVNASSDEVLVPVGLPARLGRAGSGAAPEGSSDEPDDQQDRQGNISRGDGGAVPVGVGHRGAPLAQTV